MKKMIKGIEYFSGGLLVVLSLMIFIQVVLRNFLGWGFVWTEELARYLLLTMVLIMSPVIFYRDEHVGLDFLSERIPSVFYKFYKLIIYLIVICFYVFYIQSHIEFIKQMGDVRSPSLNMPNTYFFMAGIAGAVTGCCVGIYKVFKLIFPGDES